MNLEELKKVGCGSKKKKPLSIQNNHQAVYIHWISFCFTDQSSLAALLIARVCQRRATMLWVVPISAVIRTSWWCLRNSAGVFDFNSWFDLIKKNYREFQHLPSISCLPLASKQILWVLVKSQLSYRRRDSKLIKWGAVLRTSAVVSTYSCTTRGKLRWCPGVSYILLSEAALTFESL